MADESTLSFRYDGKQAEDGIKRLGALKDELAADSQGGGLEESLRGAEVAVDELEKSIDQYGESSVETAEAQEKLDGSLEKLATRMVTTGAIIATIKANVDALATETREYSKELGINSPLIDGFATALDRASDPAGALKNTLDVAQALVDKLKEMAGIRPIPKEVKELIQLIREANPELASGMARLAIAVQEIEKNGKAAGAAAQFIREQTKALLDAADEAGVEVPESLLRIARAYDVVSTAAEKGRDAATKMADEQEAKLKRLADAAERESERIRKAVESQVSAITGGAGSLDQLTERTDILRAAVESLSERNTLSTEQQVRLGDAVRLLVADYKAMTDTPVPEWLERLNKALPNTVTETEKQTKAQAALNAEFQKSADLAKEQAEAAAKTAGGAKERIAELEGKSTLEIDELNELNDLKDKQFDLDNKAAEAARNAAQANQLLAASQHNVASSTGDALDAYFEQSDAAIAAAQGLDTLFSATQPITGAALAAAAGITDIADSSRGAGVEVRTLADGTKEIVSAAEDAGDALRGAGVEIRTLADGSRAIVSVTDAVGEFAETTKKAAKEQGGLADQAGAMAAAFGETDSLLDKINPKLETMFKRLKACREEAAGLSIS